MVMTHFEFCSVKATGDSELLKKPPDKEGASGLR